jgi:predicted O-linked N-acetylglucosamine transferase (SPINDLY family)/GR25 family glycosyltransferase involved in LPS biosynthesis
MKIVFVDQMQTKPYTPNTPAHAPLGGTQSAICYYVRELAKLGYELVLVNGVSEACEEDGVHIKPHKWYLEQRKYPCDMIVLCSGVLREYFEALHANFSSKLSVCWQENYGFEAIVYESSSFIYHVDVFAFASEYQRNNFCRMYGLPIEKSMLMINGASPFFQSVSIANKTDTFMYFSHPDRGLSVIPDIWTEIVKAHPAAKLEIYSSAKTYYNTADSANTLKTFEALRALPNVNVHDSVGQQTLAEQCGKAAFLLYPTHFVETSCIVCIESCAAGMIPLVPDLGVFPEYVTDCIRYDAAVNKSFAKRAIELLHTFYNNRAEFNASSERLSQKMRAKHNYKTLATTFLESCIQFRKLKNQSIKRVQDIDAVYSKQAPNLALYVGESFPLFFENSMAAALYFLRHGNYMMKSNYYRTADYCFLQSYKIVQSDAACNNLIMYYEKMENYNKMFEWFLTSLKYGFNAARAKQIMGHIKKIGLFEMISFLSNCEMYYKHTQDVDEFIFYCDCLVVLAQKYRLVMEHEKAITLLRRTFEKLTHFPCDMSIKRLHLKCIGSNILFSSNYSQKESCYFQDCLNYERHIPIEHKPLQLSTLVNPKIRIGFISGDFANHPVTYILNGFVPYIDTEKYELYVFDDRERVKSVIDEFTHTLKYVKHTNTHNMSSSDTIRTIREHNIDVLIDMCGHTSSYALKIMDVLRAKPAKVQCSYFAYPNTTGIKAIDYKLGDEITLPADTAWMYTEEFQCMPSGFHCYRAPSEAIVAKRKNECVKFGIFNNPQKLTYEFLQVVATILKQVPTSVLVLSYFDFEKRFLEDFYVSTFKSLGITKERIIVRFYNKVTQMSNVYSDIDISLDTFPYNGGTISIESLHYNVPYVTLLGSDYVARVGASILTQAGHPELIANTKEDYIKKAVELANDQPRLENYHAQLRTDLKKTSLENGALFAKEFEHAMKDMLTKKGFAIPIPSNKRLKAYCINLDTKRSNFEAVAEKFSDCLDIERVSAINGKERGISGREALYLTTVALFQKIIKDSTTSYAIIMEDDVYKTSHFGAYWERIVAFIENPASVWDYISLDFFINFDNPTIEDYNSLFHKVSSHRSTGFIIYNTQYLKKHISYLSNLPSGTPILDMTMTRNKEFIKLIPKRLLVKQEVDKVSLTANTVTGHYEDYYKQTETILDSTISRYIVCYPAGGIADIISNITECLLYAVKQNRLLVIDTRRIEWFKESIHEYIDFKHRNIYTGDLDILLSALNTRSTYPVHVTGDLMTFYSELKGMQMDYKGSILKRLDLTRDYEEDVVVFCHRRFSNVNVGVFHHMKFKEIVSDVYRKRRALLPSSYIGIHIRNTDHKTDVPSFLGKHQALLSEPFFLASDNKDDIAHIKTKYAPNAITFSQIESSAPGVGLHYMERTNDAHRQFVIDSFVDLLLLGSAKEVYSSVPISGYGLIANTLCKDKRLLEQTMVSATAVIQTPSAISQIHKIIYINLDKRTDRRAELEGELAKMGLTAERFPAIEGETGMIGCGLSHIAVLKRAITEEWENVLILEDDFQFLVDKDTFENQLTRFFNSNATYDVAMLSYNLMSSVPKDDLVSYVKEAQTASGYLVHKRFYGKLLANLEEGSYKLSNGGTNSQHANDQYWKSLQPTAEWFCFNKRIGRQRPSYSDIELRHVDYRSVEPLIDIGASARG